MLSSLPYPVTVIETWLTHMANPGTSPAVAPARQSGSCYEWKLYHVVPTSQVGAHSLHQEP